jgi:hypothetical protein
MHEGGLGNLHSSLRQDEASCLSAKSSAFGMLTTSERMKEVFLRGESQTGAYL